jgi:hypothetical protein
LERIEGGFSAGVESFGDRFESESFLYGLAELFAGKQELGRKGVRLDLDLVVCDCVAQGGVA